MRGVATLLSSVVRPVNGEKFRPPPPPRRPHPLTQARNPSRQLPYRGSQPSSFFVLSFEYPRELVIWATTNSPASSRPIQAGTRSGGFPLHFARWIVQGEE